MSIGDRIKELRIEKNISQEELAFEINVSRQTISKWEKGIVTPDTNNIKALCDFFNVTYDYLINGLEKNQEITQTKPINKEYIIYSIVLFFGVVLLTLGILFETVDVLKDSVKVSSFSSYASIPVGLILIILSSLLIVIFSIIFIKKYKENR